MRSLQYALLNNYPRVEWGRRVMLKVPILNEICELSGNSKVIIGCFVICLKRSRLFCVILCGFCVRFSRILESLVSMPSPSESSRPHWRETGSPVHEVAVWWRICPNTYGSNINCIKISFQLYKFRTNIFYQIYIGLQQDGVRPKLQIPT